MKNSENLRQLLHAMNTFSAAHSNLQIAIDRYEYHTGKSVNNLPGFVESYPYDKSFEEIDVNNWVTTVVETVRKTAFKVLDHDYINTGGNTMVSIFTVWIPALNRVVYALTNEEGCTLATVDYLRNDLDIDDYDELMIDNVDWGQMTGGETYFELYRHCLNVYTKADCRYFGCTRNIPYHLLSDELQSQIDASYLKWCDENLGGCVDTDGYKIIVSPDYQPHGDLDILLRQIKDFKRWHEEHAGDEELYECNYTISLADHTICIPYDAVAYNHIDDLLKEVIKEW